MSQGKVCSSSSLCLLLFAIILCIVPSNYCSLFRARVPIVDGKCDVTAYAGQLKFLEDGATFSTGKPNCAKITCAAKMEEFLGEACWAISCDEECKPIAKDPNGTFPDCCLSNCDCTETATDFGR